MITLTEVGLRDGLQLEEHRIPTDVKAKLAVALADAGYRRIEVGSFVSPKAVPAMADTAELLALVGGRPGVEFGVLVANDRGATEAVAAGAGALNVVVSASETLSQRNTRRSVDESVAVVADAVAAAATSDRHVPVSAIVATSFGCPYEGPIAPEVVIDVVGRVLDAGAGRVTLADTIGAGNPAQVRRLVAEVRALHPDVEFGFHGHDTRGMGVANVAAAVEAGAEGIDASVGGLGGCPFAGRGASGNVASEEVIGLLDGLGVACGIDIDMVAEVAAELESRLGHPLPSKRLALYKATGSAR
ncbi:MAG: hydroxymethylglutaryl-CoA lyase [Acidimicrobiia bacterium]